MKVQSWRPLVSATIISSIFSTTIMSTITSTNISSNKSTTVYLSNTIHIHSSPVIHSNHLSQVIFHTITTFKRVRARFRTKTPQQQQNYSKTNSKKETIPRPRTTEQPQPLSKNTCTRRLYCRPYITKNDPWTGESSWNTLSLQFFTCQQRLPHTTISCLYYKYKFSDVTSFKTLRYKSYFSKANRRKVYTLTIWFTWQVTWQVVLLISILLPIVFTNHQNKIQH